ncbi:hypothetical protein E4U31_002296 [Claviceps sp. LM219 group G6]|nr:hypothetical protein E4U31_002296 [Claviceps sp. LM219 group G6]KAG6115336.1 hypothetical protein E4U14_000918 [Claviceps sp. LM454 group G7]
MYAKYLKRPLRRPQQEGRRSQKGMTSSKSMGLHVGPYVEAYQHCQQHHPDHPNDCYGRFEESEATAADDEHDEDGPREYRDLAWNDVPEAS